MMDKKIKKIYKRAIMGGSFNPFHRAHLNSILTVKKQFAIDEILLIPTFKTPLKDQAELDTGHRIAMLKKVVQKYPFIKLDQQEITRKGISYTYKTIENLAEKRKQEELFFIIGLDQFYAFYRWKNYKKILEKANMIVTSRPGFVFPKKRSDWPKGLQALIKNQGSWLNQGSFVKQESWVWELKPFDSKTQKLKKAKSPKIYFCQLKDKDISSFNIRLGIKQAKDQSQVLPKELLQYIKKNQLYK